MFSFYKSYVHIPGCSTSFSHCLKSNTSNSTNTHFTSSASQYSQVSTIPRSAFFGSAILNQDQTKEIKLRKFQDIDEKLLNLLLNNFFKSDNFIYPLTTFLTRSTLDESLFNTNQITNFNENLVNSVEKYFQQNLKLNFKITGKDKQVLMQLGKKICQNNFSLETKASIVSALKSTLYRDKIVAKISLSAYSLKETNLFSKECLYFTRKIRFLDSVLISYDKQLMKNSLSIITTLTAFLIINLSVLYYVVDEVFYKNNYTLIPRYLLVFASLYSIMEILLKYAGKDIFKDLDNFYSEKLHDLFNDKKDLNEDILLYLIRSIQINFPFIVVRKQEETHKLVFDDSDKENKNEYFVGKAISRDSLHKTLGKIPKGRGEAAAPWESHRINSFVEKLPEAENWSRLICRADPANGIKKNIYRDDINLKEVTGEHGEVYFIYWDEDSLCDYKGREEDEQNPYNILRKEFDKAQCVKAGINSPGIKKFTDLIEGKYLIEIKPNSHKTKDRILGTIVPDNTIKRYNKMTGKVDRSTHLYIFNKYDVGGKITGH